MTLADAKSSRRTWLDRLRRINSPPPAASGPKPLGDIADLLVMSTVDQKAPVAAPGSADLLDAMVQEHLERDAEGAPAGDDMAAEHAPEVQDPPVAAAAGANMLQREIDMLLNDPEEEPPAPEATAPATETRTPIAETPAPEPALQDAASSSEASIPAAAADVSKAEMDVLLAREPETATPAAHESPPATPPAASLSSSAEVEKQLSDAEGVLAAELSQLVAQSENAAMPAPSAAGTEETGPSAAVVEEQLSEAEGVLAAELAQLVAESGENGAPAVAANGEKPAATAEAAAEKSEGPRSAAIVDESANAPAMSAPPVAGPTSTPAPIPAAAAAPETGVQASAGDAAAAIHTPEENAGEPTAAAQGKLRRIAEGVALTFAQLADLPFRWLTEMDKNIIGVAALLLLLGGVVLFILSRVAGT